MRRLSLAASPAAPALVAQAPESTLDQVVVTGTRAKDRTVLDSPVRVDFNSIPISAIERIEVLRDGAGAQCGSDGRGARR